jgi:hypothetical protein
VSGRRARHLREVVARGLLPGSRHQARQSGSEEAVLLPLPLQLGVGVDRRLLRQADAAEEDDEVGREVNRSEIFQANTIAPRSRIYRVDRKKYRLRHRMADVTSGDVRRLRN